MRIPEWLQNMDLPGKCIDLRFTSKALPADNFTSKILIPARAIGELDCRKSANSNSVANLIHTDLVRDTFFYSATVLPRVIRLDMNCPTVLREMTMFDLVNVERFPSPSVLVAK
jgi:hypothetical protein